MPENPLIYRDFNIEMTELKDDGTFKVRVIGQTPGGEMLAGAAEMPLYKPDEFHPLLGKLERRKSNAQEMYELGAKLAALLLPGRVRSLYERSLSALKQGEGLRLRLHIDPPALAALPWEYTYIQRTGGEPSPGDFLALQRQVSITRYETIGAALEPLQNKEKIKIVVALSSPTDQEELDVDADRRAIGAAISDLQTKTQAVESVVLEAATRAQLLKSVTGCDIFHFAGHGTFEGVDVTPDGRMLKKGKIILENEKNESERYDSDQLAMTLGGTGVRLVILGACNSASRDAGGAWSGVAPALVRENIPAVVAMQYKVRDQNAVQYMAYIYTRVLGGSTIDEAVYEGRRAIFSQAGLLDRDWGVPVLYLRAADGFLFPLPPQTASSIDSPIVRVQQQLGTLRGSAIGVEAGAILRGTISVFQDIETVEASGSLIGARIDRLGFSVGGGEPDEPVDRSPRRTRGPQGFSVDGGEPDEH